MGQSVFLFLMSSCGYQRTKQKKTTKRYVKYAQFSNSASLGCCRRWLSDRRVTHAIDPVPLFFHNAAIYGVFFVLVVVSVLVSKRRAFTAGSVIRDTCSSSSDAQALRGRAFHVHVVGVTSWNNSQFDKKNLKHILLLHFTRINVFNVELQLQSVRIAYSVSNVAFWEILFHKTRINICNSQFTRFFGFLLETSLFWGENGMEYPLGLGFCIL